MLSDSHQSPSSELLVRHLARVVESSDDAIVSKDLNGVITSWNRAAERMFGYTAAEAVGQSIRMIIPADRQSEEDFVLSRIRSGLSVSHFQTIRQRKDGSQLPISLTVSPIYDEDGTIVGASKIARDISEQKRFEAAARQQSWITERLNEVGAVVASSLERESVVQKVTDIATELTTAEFGAFFYNVVDERGETYTLYTISGVPRERFSQFPMPRNTAVFEPTFKGTGVVRSADITKDPRYGHNAPYHGMPAGHRFAVTWRFQSAASTTSCSEDCSSVTRTRTSSPRSTNAWCGALPRGPRWRWRTRVSTRTHARPTA